MVAIPAVVRVIDGSMRRAIGEEPFYRREYSLAGGIPQVVKHHLVFANVIDSVRIE